jgi:hypothetical protein
VSGLVSVVFVYKDSSKMAAKLSICTVEEERAVIRFLWSEGFKTSEIYRRMLTQYGEHFTAQKTVSEWVERFKRDRTTLDDQV